MCGLMYQGDEEVWATAPPVTIRRGRRGRQKANYTNAEVIINMARVIWIHQFNTK